MNIADAITIGRQALRSPLEAEILLAFVLGCSREYLIAHSEANVAHLKFKRFFDFLVRRERGVPITYLTNFKEFFGLGFYVDERVLIPRPETEMLVEETIKKVTIRDSRSTICDIGTGSGCIAVALAKNLPNSKIIAVDISKGALSVAKKNAKIHGVDSQITFLESDLLACVDKHVDIVVANLPYIGEVENHLVSKEVLDFEPKEALFGGKTGLELFEKLFEQIRNLRPFDSARGRKAQGDTLSLVAEMGFLQKGPISKLIKKHFGNVKVSWKNDLAGLPRLFTLHV